MNVLWVISELNSELNSELSSELSSELNSELSSELGCLPIFGVLANPNRVKYLLDYRNPARAYKKVFK